MYVDHMIGFKNGDSNEDQQLDFKGCVRNFLYSAIAIIDLSDGIDQEDEDSEI